MLASAAFYAPIQGITKLIDTLYLLDERLVSINKVLDNADMEAVFNNANRAAQEYGQTLDSVLLSLGEISKLGFNQADAEILNNNAMLLSTVGEFRSSADAANYLVAIMRQYKLEVQDVSKVVDALNHVSNKTGADTTSLAEGLSKSSSSAAMAGVTFHELNGMIANTQEVLKISGREAGTFYKTLFTRFLRPATQEAINGVGVATRDMNGELLSATTVLENLGAVWGELDSQTQNAISQQLGGVYHINKVSSLLENQENVLKNISFSTSSYGSATEELKTFQEGLQYQTNQMISSFQELAWVIGENGIRDFLLGLIEGTTNLTQGFTELTDATNGWNIKLPILIGLLYGGVKAFTLLKGAIQGVKLSLGVIGIGLVAIETLASVFIKSTASANANTESLTKNAEQMTEHTKQVQYLIARYNELSPQAKDNADKQKELQGVLQDIQKIAPHLIESTGKYGDVLTLNKTKADEYVKSLMNMTDEQIKQAQTANSIEIANINVDIDKEQSKLNKMEAKVKESFDRITKYQKNYDVSGLLDAEEDFNKRRQELNEQSVNAIQAGNRKLADSLTLDLLNMELEYDEYVRLMKDNGGNLEKYAETFGKMQELQTKKSGIEERQKALDELNSSVKNNTIANQLNNDSLSTVADGYYDLTEGTEASTDATQANTSATYENMSAIEMTAGVKEEDIDKTLEMVQVYELLSQTENLSESQTIALAQAKEYLSTMYPSLVKGSELNTDAMIKEAESNKILLKAVEASTEEQLSAQESATLASALGTKARIDNIRKSIQAMQTEYNTFVELGNKYKQMYENGEMSADAYARAGLAIGRATSPSYFGIENAMSELNGLTSSLGDATSVLAKIPAVQDKISDSTKKSTDQYERSIYVTDKLKQALESLNLQLEKQRALKAKFPEHSKKYQNAMKEEIKLLEQQKKLTEDQAKSLEKQIKSGKIKQTGMITTSSTSPSSSYATGGSNADTTWNFFKSKGFSDSIVAGIMGNLRLESNLNPNATNKSSGAFGIAQWLGGRKSGLESYAKSIGSSMNNLSTQLEYLWKELNSTEKKTLNWINSNSNSSASQMAAMFDKLFERSEGTHVPQRQKYANQYLSQYGGTGSVSKEQADISKRAAQNLQSIDEAKSELLQLQSDALNVQQQIDQLKVALIESEMARYENIMEGVSRSLEKSDILLGRYESSSQEYRNELQQQSKYLEYQNSIYDKYIAYLEEQVKTHPDLQDELSNTRLEQMRLVDKLEETNDAIKESKWEEATLALKKYTDALDDLDHALEMSELRLGMMVENSDEYQKELHNQIDLINQQKAETEKLIKSKEYLLEMEDLDIEKKEQLQEEIEDLTVQMLQYDNQIHNVINSLQSVISQQKSNLENLADEVIDIIKNIYEKQRDAALEAIDDEEKAFDRAHKSKMDALDDELSQYEEIINAKLKLLDETESEEDYQKELSKANKEKLKLEQELNELSLDDSFEAQAKRAELEEELAQVVENIEEMKLDHQREARRKNLREELEQKRKEVENEKDKLSEQEEANRDYYEDQREEINKHWNEIINDEREFDKIRQDILNGNLDSTREKFQELEGFIESNMDFIGESISENMIDRMQSVQDEIKSTIKEISSLKKALDEVEDERDSYKPPKSDSPSKDEDDDETDTNMSRSQIIKKMQQNTDDWHSASSSERKKLEAENQKLGNSIGAKYHSQSGLWTQNGKILYYPSDIEDEVEQMKENADKWKSASATQRKKLEEENQKLGKKIGAIYNSGSGKWTYKGLQLFHEGGVIGSQPVNRLTELANQLFNTKPNEQIVKSLKGELQIPPKNIPNGIKNIQNMISGLTPTASLSTGGNIYHLNINIEKIMGDQNGADQVISRIYKGVKKLGGRF